MISGKVSDCFAALDASFETAAWGRFFSIFDMFHVSENRGTPKWMVKIMENPIKMDDLGVPLFFGNIHMFHVLGVFDIAYFQLLLNRHTTLGLEFLTW